MFTIDCNLVLRGATQYKNYDFNSYANFNGMKIAASSANGICQACCGSADDTDFITSEFSPIVSDFGIPNPKRLRYVILGFQSEGDLLLEVSADDKTPNVYKILANKSGTQRTSVPIGRNMKGRYWRLTVKSILGYKFSMYYIGVIPIILTEGFK
jgi:hypothetical protein